MKDYPKDSGKSSNFSEKGVKATDGIGERPGKTDERSFSKVSPKKAKVHSGQSTYMSKD